MPSTGWKQLLASVESFAAPGKYPIAAYSEFMPPPRLAAKAYCGLDGVICEEHDPFGWHVSEYEESFELQPGLELLACELVHVMRHLGRREPAHGIAEGKLKGNPYWPDELRGAGAPEHERYVLLSPLSLSRTQDDKGRVRWTLFGGSEQGPGRAFWRGFFTDPKTEQPNHGGLDFIRRLLAAAYHETPEHLADLHRLGFRIMPSEPDESFPHWRDEPLPKWTKPYLWAKGDSLRGVKYLLTFTAFSRLPAPVRKAYRQGDLHLLPFPGSMLFWGAAPYVTLSRELPLAIQIPLLHSVERHEAPRGIRVPQSGWMHEPRPNEPTFAGPQGPLRNTFHRTHRWARIHRHEDELKAGQVSDTEDRVAHVLFSSAADDIGLYGKPMARNAQVWTDKCELLLDGPHATRRELATACEVVSGGGKFGYRFLYPAMRVGGYEVYWQRPLVAWLGDGDQPQRMIDAPLGYLTAYQADRKQPAKAIELWPRMLKRGAHEAAIHACDREHDQHYRRTSVNVRKLLDTWELLGRGPLERDFARQLLTLPRHETLDGWLAALPQHTDHETSGRQLVDQLQLRLESPQDGSLSLRERAGVRAASRSTSPAPKPLTYSHTAKRSFETAYWRLIADLSTGMYVNKDNADCVLDAKTLAHLKHDYRDLDALGDYILDYYTRTIAEHGMTGKAIAGDLPFKWQTEFPYDWMGGWKRNQEGAAEERDLVCVIPGRDRSRAVIMGDHYDTAYMEDHYGYMHGGKGPRLAAAGADDNHSATATLMLAAPVLLELSKAGQLGCDVWLIHLTGEEFPADCLGARHLMQSLVERNLQLRQRNGKLRDLSKVQVKGLYVLDMVAHNNDRDPDVFQICPGTSRQSMWLAYQAHVANRLWNELAHPGTAAAPAKPPSAASGAPTQA